MALTETTTRRGAQMKDGDLISYKARGGANYGNVCPGCLAVVEAGGYGRTYAPDLANGIFAGVVEDGVDNTAGSDGDERFTAWNEGTHVFNYSADGAAYGTATIANVGDEVYIVNNDTVGPAGAATNDIKCGKIVDILAAGKMVRIDIRGYAI